MADETITSDDNGSGKRKAPPARSKAPIDFTPKSEKLLAFLVDLFETGFPTQIALHACFGPAGKRLGPAVKVVSFKLNDDKPKTEPLVEMANLFVKLAQEDCDVLGKVTRYAVLPFDLAKSPTAYGRCMFAVTPSGTSQDLALLRGEVDGDEEEGGGGAGQKLLLGLLDQERRDKRWLMEQTLNTLSGVMERDQARIDQQQDMLDQVFEKSVKYIAATEEALSKADDRRRAAEWEKFKQNLMQEGVDMVKGLLPAVKVYLTKGKMGIIEGLKEFMEGLTDEAEEKLFGKWDKGTCLEAGILTQSQVALILGIIEGHIEPTRATEIVTSLSLEQMDQAREILTLPQINSLLALAKAAGDVKAKADEAPAEEETASE